MMAMKSLLLTSNPEAVAHYRRAAAVRATFTSESLPPPPDGEPDDFAMLETLDKALRVSGKGVPVYMLKNSERRAALAEMGADGVRAAMREITAGPDDTLQAVFKQCVEGEAPSLDAQTPAQLSALLQVIDWLDGMRFDLPPRQQVVDRLEVEQFLDQFRQLVGNFFMGRERELADLAQFTFQDVGYGLEKSVYADDVPLALYGPGGVGKSTLVAKFLLDVAARQRDVSAGGPSGDGAFAFCYLDFDRATLQPEEPLMLVAELAAQLGLQFPFLKEEALRARARWLEELSAAQESGSGSSEQAAQTAAQTEMFEVERVVSRRRGLGGWVLDQLGRLIEPIRRQRGGEFRLLLVFDSFERVQEYSFELTRALWETVNDLQKVIGVMPTLAVGRAELDDRIPHKDMELKELDAQASAGYLRKRGIPNDDVARQIYNFIGGDPLSLRLAVDALLQEHPDLTTLTTLPPDFDDLRMDHARNQGWLYRRYLSKIGDDEVRRLAHPGLVLRRVTPDLIRLVLAEPCRVPVDSDARSQDLFDRLARQASLVTLEDGQTLRHRSDVRQRMLLPLIQTEGPTVYEIHARAVEYYAGLSDATPAQRAEEIYHRLWLGQSRKEIDKRWLRGLAEAGSLREALAELPDPAKAILAAKLGRTDVQVDWNAADALSREEYVAARAEDAVRLGQPAEAVALLAEVKTRVAGSGLYLVECRALEQLGRYAEALIRANEGVFSARQGEKPYVELALLLVGVRSAEALGQYERADRLLVMAEERVEALTNALERVVGVDLPALSLEVSLRRLRLGRLVSAYRADDVAELSRKALDLARQALSGSARPALLLDAAEELGTLEPALLIDALLFRQRDLERMVDRTNLVALLTQWRDLGRQLDRSAPAATQEGVALSLAGSAWPLSEMASRANPTQEIVSGLVKIMRSATAPSVEQSSVSGELARRLSAALLEAFPHAQRDLPPFLAEVARRYPTFKVPTEGEGTYVRRLDALAQAAAQQGLIERLAEIGLSFHPDAAGLRGLADYFAEQRAAAGQGARPSTGEAVSKGGLDRGGPDAGDDKPKRGIAGGATGEPARPAPVQRTDLGSRPRAADLEAAQWPVYPFAAGLAGAMRAVCRIDFTNFSATAFLVAPDLVLTAPGASLDSAQPPVLVFDAHRDAAGADLPATTYVAAPQWLAWQHRDKNVSLIRVLGAPGNDLAPGTQERRGWLKLAERRPRPDEGLVLLHHGYGGPQVMEFTATRAGASNPNEIGVFGTTRTMMGGRGGAPYLERQWEVLAIHLGVKYGPDRVPTFERLLVWIADLLAADGFIDTLRRADQPGGAPGQPRAL